VYRLLLRRLHRLRWLLLLHPAPQRLGDGEALSTRVVLLHAA
jgi:hypothetical protein